MARSAFRFIVAFLASAALVACVGETIPESEESDADESEVLAEDIVSDLEPSSGLQQRVAPAAHTGLEIPAFELTDETLDPKGEPDPGKRKAADPQPNPWEPPTHLTDT